MGLDRTGAISICPAACTFRFVVLADMRWISPHRGSVDGIWAAASMIHLPEAAVRVVLVDLLDVIQSGGILAATVAHGLKSWILSEGGFPAAVSRAGQRVNWIVRFKLPVSM